MIQHSVEEFPCTCDKLDCTNHLEVELLLEEHMPCIIRIYNAEKYDPESGEGVVGVALQMNQVVRLRDQLNGLIENSPKTLDKD